MNLNERRKTEKRIVSWGKYFGCRFSEVPEQYLRWFIANGYSQMKDRKRWAEQELKRRYRLAEDDNSDCNGEEILSQDDIATEGVAW